MIRHRLTFIGQEGHSFEMWKDLPFRLIMRDQLDKTLFNEATIWAEEMMHTKSFGFQITETTVDQDDKGIFIHCEVQIG